MQKFYINAPNPGTSSKPNHTPLSPSFSLSLSVFEPDLCDVCFWELAHYQSSRLGSTYIIRVTMLQFGGRPLHYLPLFFNTYSLSFSFFPPSFPLFPNQTQMDYSGKSAAVREAPVSWPHRVQSPRRVSDEALKSPPTPTPTHLFSFPHNIGVLKLHSSFTALCVWELGHDPVKALFMYAFGMLSWGVHVIYDPSQRSVHNSRYTQPCDLFIKQYSIIMTCYLLVVFLLFLAM